MSNNIILIGYSGHAYVVADILLQQSCTLIGYMESIPKENNPFSLPYLGSETDEKASKVLLNNYYVVAIGDNLLRRKIFIYLESLSFNSFRAIHPNTIIASKVVLGEGVTIMAGAIINPLVSVGKGSIINTGAVIEHECQLDDFVHVSPAVTLAGNVTVGENSFIGANSTVKEGVKIGRNVLVGAGSVIVKDIPDNTIVYGNPGRRKI